MYFYLCGKKKFPYFSTYLKRWLAKASEKCETEKWRKNYKIEPTRTNQTSLSTNYSSSSSITMWITYNDYYKYVKIVINKAPSKSWAVFSVFRLTKKILFFLLTTTIFFSSLNLINFFCSKFQPATLKQHH